MDMISLWGTIWRSFLSRHSILDSRNDDDEQVDSLWILTVASSES